MTVTHKTEIPRRDGANPKRIFPTLTSADFRQAVDFSCVEAAGLFVDAGVGFVRFSIWDQKGNVLLDLTVPSNSDLRAVVDKYRFAAHFGRGDAASIFITGKLASMVRGVIGGGKVVLPAAASWLAARDLIVLPENEPVRSLAVVEL